jgi:hypothetical protein
MTIITKTNNIINKICFARQELYLALIALKDKQPNITNKSGHHLIKLDQNEIIGLASLPPEPFGHTSEKLITRRLNLLLRLDESHDARTSDGRRIEIKCARYKIHFDNGLNYCWTRITHPPNTGYDLLLLALLTEWGFKIRILDQQQVRDLAQQISRTRKLCNPQRLTIWRDDFLFVA